MNPALAQTVLALYYLTLGLLALYGLHRLHLLFLWWRHRQARPVAPEPAEWPFVTVQLPIFNERYVADRLVDAVCRLDYPPHRLEIQVLDDSTDDTREIVAARVRQFAAEGFDIHHLHRPVRSGFKAGALAAGLATARGDFIAVFDADFVPPADFLRKTVPHFADSRIGMVQARWDHLNRHYSLLTRVQAILLDGHFLIEHAARNGGGRFFNFNGTAGIWRRRAIEEAGGWTQDTLTEDLDLSYRAQLAGWRFLYLPEVSVPAELPVDVHAFKRQQYRWAKGSVQTARKILPRLLRAPIAGRVKLEACVHLTNNLAYVLMVLLSVLVVPAMILRREASVRTLLSIDLPLFLVATVSVLLFYSASQLATGPAHRGAALRDLPSLMGLGIGLAVNNTRAVLSGLCRDGGEFERTPKYDVREKGDPWRPKRYRVTRDSTFLVEGLLALYLYVGFVVSWQLDMWLSLPFLYLFLEGYSYIFVLSVRDAQPRAAVRGAPGLPAES